MSKYKNIFAKGYAPNWSEEGYAPNWSDTHLISKFNKEFQFLLRAIDIYKKYA